MTEDIKPDAEVVEGGSEDIACILAWLKREYDEDSEGLWCNENLISQASDSPGELWVIRRNREAVAFQLGKYSAAILSVRKDYRKRGLGAALVGASVKRAIRDDVNALSVQCAPRQSLGFWERMGFSRYGDLTAYGDITARRILHRTFEAPVASSRVEVTIGFYPESATYGNGYSVPPIDEYHVSGSRDDDGTIILNERAVGLIRYGGENRDTVVKIEVDGIVRCFCKAKYERSRSIGVKHDSWGGTYFIDRISSNLDEE